MGVRSSAAYAEALKRLLPNGDAWSPIKGTLWSDILEAIAIEFTRLESRALSLSEEADPRTVSDLLSEWESVAGLPDTCTGVLSLLAHRRLALWQKLTESGGQSRAFYQAVAAKLGYVIDIQEFKPFVAGSLAGDRLYSKRWRHVWRVVAFSNGIPVIALECIIRRLSPSHTTVLFSYPLTAEPEFFFDFTVGL
jgi:uncharacterized protein YmfQ (DUF2313 family)